MQRGKLFSMAFAGVAVAALSAPALADKSNDTLRVAQNEAFKAISNYYFPAREASFIYRQVYSPLINFDERTGKFLPELAVSWTRPNPATVDLELRRGVKFHDGSAFNADDVVGVLNWARDPKVKLPFKRRYTWMKSVEKLGSHKVRIVAKRPIATDLMHLAYRFFIYDIETLNSHKHKSDYGRKTPLGTGPYKITKLDRNEGTFVQRYDGYHGSKWRRSPIKFIRGIPVPDQQTQIAQLITGGVDVVRNVNAANAKSLRARSDVTVKAVGSATLGYFMLDSIGRSGKQEMKDPRVREAIFRAVDRDTIRKTVMPGGEVSYPMKALCVPWVIGCAHTKNPVDYDPAKAKKLLAQAGLAGGFELEVMAHNDMRDVAQAIAGDLRKVGIRAKLRVVRTLAMRKAFRDGKIQSLASIYPSGSMPDVDGTMGIFIMNKNRNHTGDPNLKKWAARAKGMHDVGARKQLYAKVFDRLNEARFILPMGTLPTVFAYRSNVELKPHLLSDSTVHMVDFFWK